MMPAELIDNDAESPPKTATVTDTHEVRVTREATIVSPANQADTQQAEIESAKAHPEWYFDGSRYFFKFLRFLNFLEPDRVVLSMTKVMLWAATIQTILVISTSTDILTVAGALGLNVATMVKHETRRKNSGVGD
jgi:hypothetical protein